MLFNVNFNKALIISFIWHAFCFFAVVIVIVPIAIRQRGFSDISFLGPVLDEGSFEAKFEDSGPYSVSQRHIHNKFILSPKKAEGSDKIDLSYGRDHFLNEKPYKESIDEILEAEKELPQQIEERKISEQNEGPIAAAKAKDFQMEGEAKDRALIFHPPSPDYEGFANISFNIKLKIIISADGNVKSVEILAISGEPEADLTAIRYVKKWKFAALSPDKPQKDQEGVLSLEIKK